MSPMHDAESSHRTTRERWDVSDGREWPEMHVGGWLLGAALLCAGLWLGFGWLLLAVLKGLGI